MGLSDASEKRQAWCKPSKEITNKSFSKVKELEDKIDKAYALLERKQLEYSLTNIKCWNDFEEVKQVLNE
jgi:hypothetical protein